MRIRRLILFATLCCATALAQSAREPVRSSRQRVYRDFYVSPDGTAGGPGSLQQPWTLGYALSHPPELHPGDHLWLMGGRYGDGLTVFDSRITGNPRKPIIVRQAPGQHAIINGGLAIRGAYAWYWGFEVMTTHTDRAGTAEDPNSQAPTGFNVYGPHTRFINLIVHDTRQGFGFWSTAVDSEIYGCLIYHNGWSGPTRGHGHGIYTQNGEGLKRIDDNFIFNQFGLGIQAFGSAAASVRGYSLQGNVVINNGILYAGSRADNILFANSNGLADILLEGNHSYNNPSDASGYSRLGWSFGGQNRNVIVRGNYWIGGYTAIELWNWAEAVYTGNTSFVSDGYIGVLATPLPLGSNYAWDHNTYYGSAPFRLNNSTRSWDQWKHETGLDAGSLRKEGAPSGVWTFVRPNRYEANRSHIVVYNWDRRSSVDVDVSGVAPDDARFVLRDAQNFHDGPVITGRVSGGRISIPMSGWTVTPPSGNVPNMPAHTTPLFGTFILLLEE